MRTSTSDYEIALPMHELVSFARGQRYYNGLPARIRLNQIDRMLESHDQLYPSLRLFSAPISIFGPLLSVIYLGRNYLAFRDKERVQGMIRHFDWLVREVEIAAREVPGFLTKLRGEIENP